MTVQQKQAWLIVVMCAAALVGYAVLIPLIGPQRAWGVFGIVGLAFFPGLAPGWRRAVSSMDERDQAISRRAQLMGYRVFWVCFVAVCMITWGIIRYGMHQEVMPVDYLPQGVMLAWTLFMACTSITTLVLYGRSPRHEA